MAEDTATVKVQESEVVARMPVTALQVKQDLGFTGSQAIQVTPGKESLEVVTEAKQLVQKVITLDPADFRVKTNLLTELDKKDTSLGEVGAHRSRMLQESVRTLSKGGEGGDQVTNSLISLKMQVEKADPNQWDFGPGWVGRWLGHAPIVGKKVQEYLEQFESSRTVIDACVTSVENGKERLKRDIDIFKEDQHALRMLILETEKRVKVYMVADQELDRVLEHEIGPADPRYKIIREEFLSYLRRRLLRMQKQYGVYQIGFVGSELVIRNNELLVEAVDDSLAVMIPALDNAVTVSIGLAHQASTLEQLNSMKSVTEKIMQETVEKLGTQGVQVQEAASDMGLSIESMKKTFSSMRSLIGNLSSFHEQALTRMQTEIREMEKETSVMESEIDKIEEGHQMRSAMPSLR